MVCIMVVVYACVVCFFVFKQKTAYEMRISDWSSDVCSSDLVAAAPQFLVAPPRVSVAGIIVTKDQLVPAPGVQVLPASADASWAALAVSNKSAEIGRASCRERVCQYV